MRNAGGPAQAWRTVRLTPEFKGLARCNRRVAAPLRAQCRGLPRPRAAARIDVGQHIIGGSVKSTRISVGAGDQHRALERPEQQARPFIGRIAELKSPVRRPPSSTIVSQRSLASKNAEPRLHRRRQRRVLGRQHAAQAHAVIADHRVVELDVPASLSRGLRRLRSMPAAPRESRLVALDQRTAEIGLRSRSGNAGWLGHAELARRCRRS